MSLPNPIIPALLPFHPAFTRPTGNKALVLLVGIILARGPRTVTAALKQMGLHDCTHFTLFHQVLNRASWSRVRAPMLKTSPSKRMVAIVPCSLLIVTIVCDSSQWPWQVCLSHWRRFGKSQVDIERIRSSSDQFLG